MAFLYYMLTNHHITSKNEFHLFLHHTYHADAQSYVYTSIHYTREILTVSPTFL